MSHVGTRSSMDVFPANFSENVDRRTYGQIEGGNLRFTYDKLF